MTTKHSSHSSNHDDDEVITATGTEDNTANESNKSNQQHKKNSESVEDYDGRSTVGTRKKVRSGNGFLIILFGILILVVSGYMIYKISSVKFNAKKSETQNVENDKDKFVTANADKNFAEEFKRRQDKDQQEKLANQSTENKKNDQLPVEKIDLKGEEPVIKEDGRLNDSISSNSSMNTNNVVKEKPLTKAEIRMNRLLSSPLSNDNSNSESASIKSNSTLSNEDSSLSNKDNSTNLENAIKPTVFKGVKAGVMKSRDLMIDKGTFIDCVLTTKFNSQLAGLMTCEVTRNIYSASGNVVLIDRGSKVTGQYQGGIQQGQTRVFVVWDRIVTPNGIAINIDSPASSELGESGLTGRINNHFWKRFGGAMLVSLVDGVSDGLGKSIGASAGKKLDKALGNADGTTVIDVSGGSGSSSSSTDIATKVIEQSINIPPTIIKHQGDKVTVFVSRDLDFSTVYKLN